MLVFKCLLETFQLRHSTTDLCTYFSVSYRKPNSKLIVHAYIWFRHYSWYNLHRWSRSFNFNCFDIFGSFRTFSQRFQFVSIFTTPFARRTGGSVENFFIFTFLGLNQIALLIYIKHFNSLRNVLLLQT